MKPSYITSNHHETRQSPWGTRSWIAKCQNDVPVLTIDDSHLTLRRTDADSSWYAGNSNFLTLRWADAGPTARAKMWNRSTLFRNRGKLTWGKIEPRAPSNTQSKKRNLSLKKVLPARNISSDPHDSWCHHTGNGRKSDSKHSGQRTLRFAWSSLPRWQSSNQYEDIRNVADGPTRRVEKNFSLLKLNFSLKILPTSPDPRTQPYPVYFIHFGNKRATHLNTTHHWRSVRFPHPCDIIRTYWDDSLITMLTIDNGYGKAFLTG
jgi:hypothetical protein